MRGCVEVPIPIRFLLVSHEEETAWPLTLRQALAPLGELETISESHAAERIAQYQCNAIVVIDATVIEDVPLLVSRLRLRCPQVRIIVATASPTWQRARDAFQAGAVDYIRKSLDDEELLSAVKNIISSPLTNQAKTP